jgi:Leucine-rich repeat (LRR) protein
MLDFEGNHLKTLEPLKDSFLQLRKLKQLTLSFSNNQLEDVDAFEKAFRNLEHLQALQVSKGRSISICCGTLFLTYYIY